ncbi:MAG: LssY C-terminal domain-containing protein [Pirellulales bacterium]
MSQSAVSSKRPARRRRLRRVLHVLVLFVIAYALVAYLVLPSLWRHYEHHPALATAPKTTETGTGIPGDPLNVALVGTRNEVVRAFLDAGWYPADPITLRTSLEIAERVLADRPYKTAPVSTLYLFGRRQDLAYERPQGGSPRKRQHVRLWKSSDRGADGRPLWLGAATFDDRVGLSHYTGQVTHHIDADVDHERDQLMDDLAAAGQLVRTYQVTGVGPTFDGRNGGGDRYFTDGEMDVGVISPDNSRQSAPPEVLPNPLAVTLKNRFWSWLRPLL